MLGFHEDEVMFEVPDIQLDHVPESHDALPVVRTDTGEGLIGQVPEHTRRPIAYALNFLKAASRHLREADRGVRGG